jgi:hypothetical protein
VTVLVWGKNWVSSMELHPQKINQEENMVVKHMRRSGSGFQAKLLPDGAFSPVQLESQVQTRLKGDRKAKLEILANWLHLPPASRL